MSETYDRATGEVLGPNRWSEPASEIFGALAKAQNNIKNALRDSTNPHFRSRYADLAAVKEACWEHLTAAGIAVVQMPVNVGQNIGVTTLLAHSSGQWIESTVYVQPTKFDAQGVGSVITYLRRYALAAMAGVAPDDDDGEAAVGRPAEDTPARSASRSNGATRAPQRQQAAPAPSDAAAEVQKRWREIAHDIDAEEDKEMLLRLGEWQAFETLDKLSAELGPPEVHAERMGMLQARATKRHERLVGSLEPFGT